MVSSANDPIVFIPLKVAQESQLLKDNEAFLQQRRRTTENPNFNRPTVLGLLDAVIASQTSNTFVNAVLVQINAPVRCLRGLTVVTSVATAYCLYSSYKWPKCVDKQTNSYIGKTLYGMFLAILSIVSAAIVAFIICTLTLGKIREIAVLKLIGKRNRTIAGMIIQQAIALGVIGFVVGKISATLFMAPIFPKYVLLEPLDSIVGFFAVVAICILSSVIAIRAALKIDPAEAIG